MKKAFNLFVVLSVVLLAVSCAMAPYSQMTPEDRATQIMSVYNDQYELYLREAKMSDLTEDKKLMLRQKKVLMQRLYPYIRTYINYAEKGVFAPQDIEAAVTEIMYQLLEI